MRLEAFVIAAGALSGCRRFAAPAAHAQLSENGGPVSYSANNLEYFDAERRLRARSGDVDIVQNDARLRADRHHALLQPASSGGRRATQSQARASARATSSA